MKQSLLQDKYPIFSAEIPKSESRYQTIAELMAHFQRCIDADERVQFISVFDHYAHTQRIGGCIAPEIKASHNIVFCFGLKLPNPFVLAVRPRAIGVADMGEYFAISFMEPPMEAATQAMQAWVQAVRK